MPVQVERLSRETVDFQLKELEVKFSMPSAHFIDAFRNGRLHETPDFLHWSHLIAVRSLFDRSPQA